MKFLCVFVFIFLSACDDFGTFQAAKNSEGNVAVNGSTLEKIRVSMYWSNVVAVYDHHSGEPIVASINPAILTIPLDPQVCFSAPAIVNSQSLEILENNITLAKQNCNSGMCVVCSKTLFETITDGGSIRSLKRGTYNLKLNTSEGSFDHILKVIYTGAFSDDKNLHFGFNLNGSAILAGYLHNGDTFYANYNNANLTNFGSGLIQYLDFSWIQTSHAYKSMTYFDPNGLSFPPAPCGNYECAITNYSIFQASGPDQQYKYLQYGTHKLVLTNEDGSTKTISFVSPDPNRQPNSVETPKTNMNIFSGIVVFLLFFVLALRRKPARS